MPSEVKRGVDELLPSGWADGLAKVIRAGWVRAAERSLGLVGEQLDEPPIVDLDDPDSPLRRVIDAQTAARIKAIEAETTRRVAGYVSQATQEGMSVQQLANLIEADKSGAFGKARATVIARTEINTAYNLSSVEGYRASGRVDEVRVFDGDDCGWTSHDDPDKADGTIRTLDDAEEYPLSHPNCVRSFAPRSRL